jgi:hypothetical protein
MQKNVLKETPGSNILMWIQNMKMFTLVKTKILFLEE